MLKSQINQSHSFRRISPKDKPFLAKDVTYSSSSAYSHTLLLLPTTTKKCNATRTRRPTSRPAVNKIKAIYNPLLANVTKVTGVIHTKYADTDISDGISSLSEMSLLLEFVSVNLDSNGKTKTVKTKAPHSYGSLYNFEFEVPDDFGEIGAVLVENDFGKKRFIEKIVVTDKVRFTCNSWVHSKTDNPNSRIFFADKCYLPSETPDGLRSLRSKDLESIRGNGQGERKPFERIYDYDVYNDLGNPESSSDLQRPVLGGKEFPYPRRCRTGRKMSSKDPLSETRSMAVYVPIDEDFSQVKSKDFGATRFYNIIQNVLPYINTAGQDFHLFQEIDSLFDQGVPITGMDQQTASMLPQIKPVDNVGGHIIKFDTPETIRRDTFFWLRDDEFSRQTLAGPNPVSIQLVTEWPLMSKLDPQVYGPPESEITKEIVERVIRGFMTFDEVINENRKPADIYLLYGNFYLFLISVS